MREGATGRKRERGEGLEGCLNVVVGVFWRSFLVWLGFSRISGRKADNGFGAVPLGFRFLGENRSMMWL